MTLHKFIILFGTCIILINLIIAFFTKKAVKPVFFKYIIIYIVLGLLISANTISNIILTHPIDQKKYRILFDILYLCQSLSLFFFFKITTKRKIIFPFMLTSSLVQAIFTLKQFYSDSILDINIFATPLFIILSILYFRDLLQNKPLINLTQSSSFWIVVGIFFWACVSFPIYSLHPHIKAHVTNKNIILEIFSISNMALIVMYLFFIKSFLCLKHPQNTQ